MIGRRDNRVGLGVLLLAYQLFAVGFDQIPPVTLVAILVQTGIFLGFIPDLDPRRTYSLCLRPDKVWFGREWWRLFPSTVMHGSDMHLYYNMISFLWKGRRLERKFGSVYFGYLLVVFAGLTSALMVGISVILEEQIGFRQFGLMHQCAVGFSGVIFALKVLCNHYFPHEDTWFMGWFLIPSRLACWAELFLIYILVPNSSFIGHLAGILVGLAYVRGPLKAIMESVISPEYEHRRQQRQRGGADAYHREQYSGPRGRFYGSGTWGNDGPYQAADTDINYHAYTGGLSEEEQLRRAMEESSQNGPTYRQPSAPPMYGWNLDGT